MPPGQTQRQSKLRYRPSSRPPPTPSPLSPPVVSTTINHSSSTSAATGKLLLALPQTPYSLSTIIQSSTALILSPVTPTFLIEDDHKWTYLNSKAAEVHALLAKREDPSEIWLKLYLAFCSNADKLDPFIKLIPDNFGVYGIKVKDLVKVGIVLATCGSAQAAAARDKTGQFFLRLTRVHFRLVSLSLEQNGLEDEVNEVGKLLEDVVKWTNEVSSLFNPGWRSALTVAFMSGDIRQVIEEFDGQLTRLQDSAQLQLNLKTF